MQILSMKLLLFQLRNLANQLATLYTPVKSGFYTRQGHPTPIQHPNVPDQATARIRVKYYSLRTAQAFRAHSPFHLL